MLVKMEINLLLQLFNKNEKKRTFCTTLTISMYDDQETGYCSCDYCGVFTLPDTEAETETDGNCHRVLHTNDLYRSRCRAV